MIIGPGDERPALAAIAEQLATAYRLLLERNDSTLDPVMDAVFEALASVDVLPERSPEAAPASGRASRSPDLPWRIPPAG